MGRGGRGRGGKKRGGGRGKSKGRRRWEDDDEAAVAAAEQYSGRKRKAESAEVEVEAQAAPPADDAEPVPVVRSSRPGFSQLLTALGVSNGAEAAETSDDGSGDEDSGTEASEDAADANGKAPDEQVVAADVKMRVSKEDGDAPALHPGSNDAADSGEEDEEVAESEDEATQGVGEAKAAQCQPTGTCDGMNFYPRFWDDPPAPIADILSGSGAAAASTLDQGQQAFRVSGLDRCESKRRDVSALVEKLQTSAEASAAWRRCGLSPGLREVFEEHMRKEGIECGAIEGALFLFSHAYLDVSFPQHTHLNSRAVRALCAMHAADHVLKALADTKAFKSKKAKASGKDVASHELPADKGFTRARVLILCPFKSVCYEYVKTLLALMPWAREVRNRQRFEEEFGPEDGASVDERKPADWNHLFQGNNDDRFRVGMAVSRKAVKLYAPLDASDIIIGSPLGIRLITGTDGERKREYDFLSSIEVLLIDRADVIRFQNWEHLVDVLRVVNSKPRDIQGIDISRLRPEFADGRARAFRQTLVTASGLSMDADALFTDPAVRDEQGSEAKQRKAMGLAAKLAGSRRKSSSARRRAVVEEDDEKDGEELPWSLANAQKGSNADGVSCRGYVRLAEAPQGTVLHRTIAAGIARQFFLHAPCDSVERHSDDLFKAFEQRYWKPLGSSLERLFILAPSYFAFLRLRRFFKEQSTSFCSMHEYSSNKSNVHARQAFSRGERRVMLVSERVLFFHRYRLKGADYVLFYGPPEVPEIYDNVLGNVRTPSHCNAMCLFTPFDSFAVERIVGQDRARRMLASEPGKVFVYS